MTNGDVQGRTGGIQVIKGEINSIFHAPLHGQTPIVLFPLSMVNFNVIFDFVQQLWLQYWEE